MKSRLFVMLYVIMTLLIVSIGEAQPRKVGQVYNYDNGFRDIMPIGDRLYVATKAGKIQALDYSDPENPVFLAEYDVNADFLFRHEDQLICAGKNSSSCISFANPDEPVIGVRTSCKTFEWTASVDNGRLYTHYHERYELFDFWGWSELVFFDDSANAQTIYYTNDVGSTPIDFACLRGDNLFLTNWDIIEIWDISEPAEPTIQNTHLMGAPLYATEDGEYFLLNDRDSATLSMISVTGNDTLAPLMPVYEWELPFNPTFKRNLENERLLLQVDEFTNIYDFTDPTQPTLEYQFHIGEGRYWFEENRLWRSDGHCIELYHISEDGEADLVSQYTSSGGKVIDVKMQGDLAIIATGATGLRLVDVSNPAEPLEISSLADGRQPFMVYLLDELALTVNLDTTLAIIDISDPRNPQLESVVELTFQLYRQPILAAFESCVYIWTESSSLRIFDISNRSDPVERNSLQIDLGYDQLLVENDLLLLCGHSAETAQVYELTDPAHPRLISQMAIPPGTTFIDGHFAHVLSSYRTNADRNEVAIDWVYSLYDISDLNAVATIDSQRVMYGWNCPGYQLVAVKNYLAIVRTNDQNTLRIVDGRTWGQDFHNIGTVDVFPFVACAYEDETVCLAHTNSLGIYDLSGYFSEVPGESIAFPEAFSLSTPYPNPFNSTTTIGYSLPAAGNVSLAVYDLRGREVTRLVDGVQPAGTHEAVWTADGVSSGVYVVKMTAGEKNAMSKVVLVK